MLCKCCNQRWVTGKKQIKIPHPDGGKKYKIVHEDEDMCRVCISYSENYNTDDEVIDFEQLGLDIPSRQYDIDNLF